MTLLHARIRPYKFAGPARLAATLFHYNAELKERFTFGLKRMRRRAHNRDLFTSWILERGTWIYGINARSK